MKYLYVESIILEVYPLSDSGNEIVDVPMFLPKGGYFEIVETLTAEPLADGTIPKAYKLRFRGSNNVYFCAPNWWQAREVNEVYKDPGKPPPDEFLANAQYKLVKLTESELADINNRRVK